MVSLHFILCVTLKNSWLCAVLDFALYEEVEAYTGQRPVVIFGVLADQVVNSLLESFPKLFYQCPTGR